jgi:hypothetical protein
MKVGINKILTIALLLTVALILTSCATTSSQIAFHEEVTTKNQNDAIVYLYRLPSFVGGAVSLPVKLDEKKVANLKQNAYVVFRVTPGEHIITVGDSFLNLGMAVNQAITKKSRTFSAVPKGVYYLRSHSGVTFLVTKEEAMKEIVDMKYDMGL